MCATCGCSDGAEIRMVAVGGDVAEHDHAHPHEHLHAHEHDSVPPAGGSETLTLEQRVLAKNDLLAARNRGWLDARGVRAVNVMSSPGAGKTTLLVRTVRELGVQVPIYVVEGDQETTLDAERIGSAGAPVVQVNTGSGCHLDASMLASALHALDPTTGGLVLIENVGNLVCPALFDLGENARVVVMSVTEGADKPLKYPHIFRSATVVVLNKIDLLPYVEFDEERFTSDLKLVNPGVQVLPVSATACDGLDAWYQWLSAAASSRPTAS